MEGYKSGSLTPHKRKAHMVWITKYRRPVLVGQMALRVRQLFRELCAVEEVEILKGHASGDHMHLLVGYPPRLAVSKSVQRLKGKFVHALTGVHGAAATVWAYAPVGAGYFVASSENLTDEMIMAYIEGQDQERGENDLRVSEEVW